MAQRCLFIDSLTSGHWQKNFLNHEKNCIHTTWTWVSEIVFVWECGEECSLIELHWKCV